MKFSILCALLLAGCCRRAIDVDALNAESQRRLQKEADAERFSRELEMVWTNWLATNKQFHHH